MNLQGSHENNLKHYVFSFYLLGISSLFVVSLDAIHKSFAGWRSIVRWLANDCPLAGERLSA
ncbi:hypothetical protein, partial [uncultured Parabacteroides sp.]